jgi:hypothetical protein
VQPRDAADRECTWTKLANVAGLRVIWLRRNPVRRVVSFAIAKRTGEWVGKKTREPVELDPDYLVRRLRFDEQEASRAREAVDQCDVLDVHFESLVESPEPILRRLQDFLGVPHRPVHSGLDRQNPRTLHGMISNAEEVVAALRGTKWENPSWKPSTGSPRSCDGQSRREAQTTRAVRPIGASSRATARWSLRCVQSHHRLVTRPQRGLR